TATLPKETSLGQRPSRHKANPSRNASTPTQGRFPPPRPPAPAAFLPSARAEVRRAALPPELTVFQSRACASPLHTKRVRIIRCKPAAAPALQRIQKGALPT